MHSIFIAAFRSDKRICLTPANMLDVCRNSKAQRIKHHRPYWPIIVLIVAWTVKESSAACTTKNLTVTSSYTLSVSSGQCFEFFIRAVNGMALTLDASQYSNLDSSASVKSCLSVSCNDATDLGTLSYWSTGPFWSSTGYLHVIPNVGYGSFEAQVGPSCPQQGYFLNTSGSCVKCKLCDPNSNTPNKSCSAGAYQDDSLYMCVWLLWRRIQMQEMFSEL